MMTQTVSRLNATNAANNWMRCASLLCSFKGNSNYLQQQMLRDSFNFQCYSAMADTEDKVRKENIKRTFSIFA